MKKIVSLVLTACFIFLVSCGIWPKSIESEENAILTWDLYSISELSSKLESEKVNIDDASAYEIGVLIELADIALEEGIDFNTKNISTDSEDIVIYDLSVRFFHFDILWKR